MSSAGTVRRQSKRSAGNSLRPKMTREFDLNSPPVEVGEGGSASVNLRGHRGTSGAVSGGSRQWVGPLFDLEISISPIDLDAVDDDDDVQMLYSSTRASQTGNQYARNHQPVFVIIDEDLEVTPAPSVSIIEEPVTTVTLDTHNRRERISPIDDVITLDLFPKGKNVVKSTTVEPLPEAASKELTFSCPVCLNPLVEPCSTNCGHIFCRECIRASIRTQKKCPTCRKKLNMNNFHRVYLPTAE